MALIHHHHRQFETDVAGNAVALLHDADALRAMLEAIDAARSEILFEVYWFGSDRTGRRFADALGAKAASGIRVCVIYDAVGSIGADESMFDAMRAAGCRVHQYNPIAPWRRRFRIGLVNNRDHRKVIVIDGRVGFTGGVNIGDPWAAEADGGGGWRDDMIRVEGPAALQLRRVFFQTWGEVQEREPAPIAVSDPGAQVRVLTNHFRAERQVIRRTYLGQIELATSHLYITNSYFIPDRAVRRALARACARGVDVQVLVPGESDVPAVQYAGQRLYEWLLRAGVRLHAWQGSILHSKTACADDRWCTVGTYNLDHRSWRTNLEVNVMVRDPAVARAVAERFRADAERSVPIELDDWRYRPLGERVLEQFFYLFRAFL